MHIEQIYTNCLAEAAYYIESNGKAAIIDPLRETEPYIQKAEERGARIDYILETHFHADFVSGHIDLAEKTGARIVYGPGAEAEYDIHVASDGEELPLGDVTIKVLHTPGHTLESSTYLLLDENGKEHAIFTGDTLFVGDVGRPDLAVSTDTTQEDLAGHLYDSLHEKILPLPDEVIVYPGHGAGSACGKNIGSEKYTTLGEQKATNYALQDMTREEFIKELTEGLNEVPPPQYFPKDAQINKKGYESIDKVMERGNKALSLPEFEEKSKGNTVVLDTRSPEEFVQGFIPGSINIGLDGSFAVWVGTLIEDLAQPILLLAPQGREEETVLRLARVGYDNPVGFLKGGFTTWKDAGRPVDRIEEVLPEDLEEKKREELKGSVLDVRKPGEYNTSHLLIAKSFPLDFIQKKIGDLEKEKEYFLHCQTGYRSVTACSILRSKGYDNVRNIKGGFEALQRTDLPVGSLEPSSA